MAGELAERDPADVAALLQLGHVFGDRVVERDLALLDRLRQQGGGEHLSDRGEVEQRIGGHRLLAGRIGHAVVEEHGAAVDVERDRHAAGREQERLDVTGDEVAQRGVGLGPRRRGRDCGGERNEAERRHHCSRHAAHRSLLSGTIQGGTSRTSHHAVGRDFSLQPRAAELIRVHADHIGFIGGTILHRHSGAPRSGAPGIHNRSPGLWIPGSLAAARDPE